MFCCFFFDFFHSLFCFIFYIVLLYMYYFRKEIEFHWWLTLIININYYEKLFNQKHISLLIIFYNTLNKLNWLVFDLTSYNSTHSLILLQLMLFHLQNKFYFKTVYSQIFDLRKFLWSGSVSQIPIRRIFIRCENEYFTIIKFHSRKRGRKERRNIDLILLCCFKKVKVAIFF